MPMSRRRSPRLLEEDYGNGVVAVTVIGDREIAYSVRRGTETVWSRTVEFSNRKRNWQVRREAATEQDEVATREAGAKQVKFGRRRTRKA